MKEAQARAFQAQIKQEFPDQIKATMSEAKGGRNGTMHTVRLTLISQQFVLTVYQPEEWESVKQAWGWFLGLETKEEEKPVRHLVGDRPMVFYQAKDGYWRGRYQEAGLTKHKYFGRQDPRPNYPIYEEDKAS